MKITKQTFKLLFMYVALSIFILVLIFIVGAVVYSISDITERVRFSQHYSHIYNILLGVEKTYINTEKKWIIYYTDRTRTQKTIIIVESLEMAQAYIKGMNMYDSDSLLLVGDNVKAYIKGLQNATDN